MSMEHNIIGKACGYSGRLYVSDLANEANQGVTGRELKRLKLLIKQVENTKFRDYDKRHELANKINYILSEAIERSRKARGWWTNKIYGGRKKMNPFDEINKLKRVSGIDVYPLRHSFGEVVDKGGINWPAKGTLTIAETEKFIKQLKKAIALKKKVG